MEIVISLHILLPYNSLDYILLFKLCLSHVTLQHIAAQYTKLIFGIGR